MEGLNKSTWTCDIWRAQWAFYSLLIHPDNNSHCSTNMARDVRRKELEKCHRWFVCVIQLNHALFIMEPSIMKENTQTAQTLSVCLAPATLDRHRKKTSSLLYFVEMEIFYFFSPPSSILSQHTLGILLWIPLESVTQTNQYAVIVCPHPCIMLRQAAGMGWGSASFPLHWQCSVLAVGRWCFCSEMDERFPVDQNAYGYYDGHYFTLAWHELLVSNVCLAVANIFLRGCALVFRSENEMNAKWVFLVNEIFFLFKRKFVVFDQILQPFFWFHCYKILCLCSRRPVVV